MVRFPKTVLIAMTPVNLHLSFDRLAALVRHELGSDPRADTVVMFHNRRRTHVKLLWHDGTGYVVLWDERCDPRAEVERLQDERDRAVAPGLLEKVAKLAAGDLDQALLRDGRASDVPAQPLEARAVASRYRDLGVHVC